MYAVSAEFSSKTDLWHEKARPHYANTTGIALDPSEVQDRVQNPFNLLQGYKWYLSCLLQKWTRVRLTKSSCAEHLIVSRSKTRYGETEASSGCS
jgi:hypothetical protein